MWICHGHNRSHARHVLRSFLVDLKDEGATTEAGVMNLLSGAKARMQTLLSLVKPVGDPLQQTASAKIALLAVVITLTHSTMIQQPTVMMVHAFLSWSGA